MKKPIKVKENGVHLWRIPPLRAEDNKYTRGAMLILGGEEMTGAARLAALAAQRAGAGLVVIATTPKSWPVYAASLLSVMARPMNAAGWKEAVADARVKALLIGPGAGVNARTKQAMLAASKAGKPVILDADALTLLAQDEVLRKAMLHVAKILTPHAGEYARLATALGIPARGNVTETASSMAKLLQAVVIVKGCETYVTDGVKLYVTHPPNWLASGGTGDVLAGIVAAMVAQGMPLLEAANAGVWLHAEAARKHGRGMIAEDVIVSIPDILREIDSTAD